jgi:hypothetical protein
MEDKWFVCSEGEVKEGETIVVNFHRSWTGYKISAVEVEVGKEGEGGRVKALVWEGSEDVVKGPTFEGAKDGVREVCRWVLGVHLGADE